MYNINRRSIKKNYYRKQSDDITMNEEKLIDLLEKAINNNTKTNIETLETLKKINKYNNIQNSIIIIGFFIFIIIMSILQKGVMCYEKTNQKY